MPEQRAAPLPQDPLHELAQGPLLPRDEWAGLQVLDGVRERFDRFLSGLEGTEKSDFVRLQKAHIQAQSDLEAAIEQLANTFEQQALASLREGLKSLTGQDIDPKLAHIHTRYLKPANRVRRAESGDQIAVASLTLWEAACMNYGGLTGWSYPGNTGLKEASYLDTPIKASAGAFIDLVRRLNLGSQLRQALERALRPTSELGARLMGFARAEFEFAQVEALNNVALSRVDLDKYRWLQRAQNGEVPWGKTEEMQLFISDGADSTGWLPQDLGFMGLYKGKPKGDYLSIPHVIFSIEGCPGVFSYFPNRPGGTLRHHTHATEAAREFYVAFHGAFQRGHVDWLYKSLALSDCARLKRITQSTPKPPGLNLFAEFLFDLSRHLPTLTPLEKIGYQRQLVNRAPVDSLYDIYLQRCRSNLQALAHQTPGLMPTLIEFFQTLFNEIIELLLIPAPGALRGLGRVRQVAMFTVLAKGLADAGVVVSQGHSGEALQTFVDLADLLISSRLHTRLALTVRRRHQGLYRRLSQQYRADAAPLTDSRKLQRMLGNSAAPARDLAVVLKSSDTSTSALSQVWDGARPSAALVEAAQRFNADRLIDWIANPEAHERPPLGAFHALGPLLTQVAGWPQDTSLRIQSPGGELLRCYSRGPGMGTVRTLEVTLLENHQFAYSNPRRVTDYLPTAVLALLPSSFLFGETAATLQSRTRQLRRLLADQASAVRGALFDALTRFAELPRGVVTDPQVKPLLAELTSREQALPTVIEKLHRLHPYLSLARLVEVLARHPLSAHQQEQLLRSDLQPEALYLDLRAARQLARREALIDGVFHPRQFNPQAQAWTREVTRGVLLDGIGQALVVAAAERATPYLTRGATDRTVVVLDHGQGRFAPFYHREARKGPIEEGADSFQRAVIRQLCARERALLTLRDGQAHTDLCDRVGDAMLRQRAADGSFYLRGRQIADYAIETGTPPGLPDAQGLYHQGALRLLFLEGHFFQIADAPWRIQHPALQDAYAPTLIHNGAGAWRHEWENPLSWEGQKPFCRLGPQVRGLTPRSIDPLMVVSDVTPNILRRVHVRNEPMPVQLLDAVQRFTEPARSQRSIDPLAQVIQRDFSSLPAVMAEDMLQHASAAERQSLAAGRVPLRLAQEARWLSHDVRINRACEGLYWPSARNADSDRLLLHTLAAMPGWPAGVRIEIEVDGMTVDSIGAVDAPIKRRLKAQDGALLTLILQALPEAQRQGLGYTDVGAEEALMLKLAERATADRARIRALLHMKDRQPWFNPPARLADGRIGYPLSGERYLPPEESEQVERMRLLYPVKSPKNIEHMLRAISDSLSDWKAAIDAKFQERDALYRALDQWHRQGSRAEADSRQRAVVQFKRCWRQETFLPGGGHQLDLSGLALSDLPELPAYFGHVTSVKLARNRLTRLRAPFLRPFSNVREVSLGANQLTKLPDGLHLLPSLERLELADNRIRLDLREVMYLAGLTTLAELDLSFNPLGAGTRLNLYRLGNLRVLRLRSTFIDALPRGAVTLQTLRTFDVRDNQIKVLSRADLYINESIYRALDLHGNPLSTQTLQMLSDYRRRPGHVDVNFGLDPQRLMRASIARWLAVMPLSDVARLRDNWSALNTKPQAEAFFSLLGRIDSDPRLTSQAFVWLREDIARQVWQMIDSAVHNEHLESLLLGFQFAHLDGGVDGALLDLNNLALHLLPWQMLAQPDVYRAKDFLHYYQARCRLGALTYRVRRWEPGRNSRELCARLLAYRVALGPSLGLPLALTGHFDPPMAGLTAQSLDQMHRLVVDEEIDWAHDLLEIDYWRAFLERKHAARFAAVRNRYERAREVAANELLAGRINIYQYKRAVEAVRLPCQRAEMSLMEELNEREWSAFAMA